MKLINKNMLIGCFVVPLMIFSSCKKWIEVDPPINQTTAETVYGSSSTAIAVMNSVYFNMSKDIATIDLCKTADEVQPPFPEQVDNMYLNDYSFGAGGWEYWYKNYIFQDNSVIEGVGPSAGIPDNIKVVLIAEAKFNRAFVYFYLVNLYGDVPLVLTTNLKTNSNIGRTASEMVYDQIEQDLKDAKAGLTPDYLDRTLQGGTNERVRPNRSAASALLSRVYLFRKKWALAEQEASEVINNPLYGMVDLGQVFLKNSKETIWALQPGITPGDLNVNTIEGLLFVPSGDLPPFYGQMTPWLYGAFEAGDNRRSSWVLDFNDFAGVNHKLIYKYKVGDANASGITDSREYSIQFRLAEQYLIRAEARANLGKLTGAGSAKEDIDVVRTRAGLAGTPATGQQELLSAVMQERRVELFTENGHRWLDLKRTGTVGIVMGTITPLKGGIWQDYKALFPIPYGEFTNNPALRGHQNPGYRETF